MKKIFNLFVLIIFLCLNFSQITSCQNSKIISNSWHLMNLDFENIQSNNDLTFWRTNETMNMIFRNQVYSFVTTKDDFLTGEQAILISNKNDKADKSDFFGFTGATLFQTIDILINQLKNDDSVSISVNAKILSLENGLVNLSITNGENSKVQTAEISKEWQKLKLDFKAKDYLNAHYLALCLSLNGKGSVVFDNLNIKINEVPINKYFNYSLKIDENLESLESKIIKLNTESTPIFSKEKLEQVKVFGLGESTHGTKEFFEVRKDILKQISESYKTIFLFESGLSQSLKVQDYLDSKVDSLNNGPTVGSGPLVWRINELQETMNWIRDNNRLHSRILFFGVDIYQSENSFLEIINTLDKCEDKEIAILKTKYIDAHKKYKELAKTFDLSKVQRLKKVLLELSDSIKLKSLTISDCTLESIKWLKLNAFQAIQLADYLDNLSREKAMAQVIKKISELYPDYKLVFWAHHTHVSLQKRETGDYLNNIFGNSYNATGIYTARGTFSAVPYGKFELKPEFELVEPFIGSLEYFLDKISTQPFYLDFKNIDDFSWVKTPILVRSIGSRVNNQYTFSIIPNRFLNDVIFIPNTHSSEPLN